LELFGRLTDIGVTLDWQSCRANGIDENPTVQVKLESGNLHGLLQSLLAQHKLKLELDPNGFPHVVPQEIPAQQEETWKLDEIVEPSKAKELATLLVAMWDVEPMCREENGAIVWSASASAIDKSKGFATLRQLAKSLGKPAPNWPGTARFAKSPFSLDAWKECRTVLAKTVPASVLQQESRCVTAILQSSAKEVHANIFIDWKSAWAHGLSPTEEAISVLRNRTLPMIANRYLLNYALELVPIDADTFLLTTGKSRQSNLCVVPIRLQPDQKLENVKRALSTLRPIASDGSSRLQVRLVPGQSDLYLARICPPNSVQVFKEEITDAFGW
jgi:hypothetical protein